MPDVIDALVITLGLDASKFTEGQKSAVQALKGMREEGARSAREMEASGKQAANYFGQIKKEALGLFAVIVGAGGLEQFTAKTVGGMTALGRQAKLMGQSVSDLQAFKMMIDRTGASGDAAAASFTSLAEAMERWRRLGTISPELLRGLNQIGETNPNASPLEVYERFADWATGKSPRDVNLEGQLLGLDPGSIAMATKGGAAVRAGIAQSYQAGVPTEADVKRVSDLMGAFQGLRQAITGDANALLYQASPALTQFLTLTTAIIKDNPTLVKAIMAIATALTVLGSIRVAAGTLGFLAGLGRVGGVAAGAAGVAEGAGAATVGGLAAPAALLGWAALIAAAPTDKRAAATLARRKIAAEEEAQKHGYSPTRAEDIRQDRAALAKLLGVPESHLPASAIGSGAAPAPKGAGALEWFFSRHGLTAEQASGVVAGIVAETGGQIRADVVNPVSGAYGIGQWLGSRKRALFARYGPHPNLSQELQFLLWELMGGDRGGAAVRGAHSAGEALYAYVNNVMRPGIGTAGDLVRGARYLGGRLVGGASTVVNINGPITVATNATDANGVARGLGRALKRNLALNGNSGLQG